MICALWCTDTLQRKKVHLCIGRLSQGEISYISCVE